MKPKLPSKKTIYFYVFGILTIVVTLVLIWNVYIKKQPQDTKEHFVEDDYEARLHVMKIFDLILGRKPTSEEIDKYATFHNEQDILLQIIKDYKSNETKEENTIQEENTEVTNATETFEETKPSDDLTSSFGDITAMLKEKAKNMVKQLDQTVKEKYIDDSQQDKICFKKKDIHDMLINLQAELDKIKTLVK